jgi:hypothetical protein
VIVFVKQQLSNHHQIEQSLLENLYTQAGYEIVGNSQQSQSRNHAALRSGLIILLMMLTMRISSLKIGLVGSLQIVL